MAGRSIVLAALLFGACDGAEAPTEAPAEDPNSAAVAAKPKVKAKSKSKSKSKAKSKPKPKAKPKQPGPDAGQDLDAIAKKLQGTWLLGKAPFHGRAIWEVKGDNVTITDDDGKVTKATFEVVAPCLLTTTEIAGDKVTTEHPFVFDADTLLLGGGSAGRRFGDVTVACVSSGVFVLKADKCERWDNEFLEPRTVFPGTCKYDGDTFITNELGDDPTYGELTLTRFGDILKVDKFRPVAADKMPDLAAAKKAQAAK